MTERLKVGIITLMARRLGRYFWARGALLFADLVDPPSLAGFWMFMERFVAFFKRMGAAKARCALKPEYWLSLL
jgi:hypothetical protein